MNKWKNEINLNYTYLDMIDLQPYLEKATTINELMREVQHDYENNKFPEYFNLFIHAFEDDWVFNYLSDYDMAGYLADKYNISIDEQEYTEYYIQF